MVGDSKQSIYQFRLADPEIFEKKNREYTLNDSDRQNIGEYKRKHQGSTLKAVECFAAQQKAVHKNKGNG